MWGHLMWLVSGLPLGLALVALLWRRTHPLRAMAVFVGLAITSSLVQMTLADPSPRRTEVVVPLVAVVLLSYSLGSRGEVRTLVLGAPLPALLVFLANLLQGVMTPMEAFRGAAFTALFFVAIPAGVGRVVKVQRDLADDLAELERGAARDHEMNVRRVRAEQQLTLAAELRETLDSGLHALTAEQDRAAFELQARSLLASTRDAVVSLTEPGPVPVAAVRPLAPARAVPRLPLAAIAVSWVAFTAWHHLVAPLDGTVLPLALLVVTQVLVGLFLPPRWTALPAIALAVLAATHGLGTDDPAGLGVVTVLAVGGGLAIRRRRVLAGQVREAHAHASDGRLLDLEQAATEERLVAAREVHDAVGHRLTVAAIQAGAARRLPAHDRRGDEAFAHARLAVTQALEELATGFSVAPSTSELIRDAHAAGADIEVVGQEPTGPSSEVVRRVLQECLTNALRHSPGAAVRVEFGETVSGTSLLVTSGRATRRADPSPGGGRGLLGIQARVEAMGGVARWSPTDDGGFRVLVHLPERIEVPAW